MKYFKIYLLTAAISFSVLACNSNREPSKGTGQDDGINTIDSSRSQTSDTAAPGAPPKE
mgnify:CR=1 FL=1